MDSEIIWTLLTIIGIDIILGGDNAIVVALACKNLPKELRNKAIVLGIILAVVARASLTLVAVQLLSIPFLMPIGGIFLIWIAFRLIKSNEDHSSFPENSKVRDAIKTIVIADIVMGFDNVIAVAGAAEGNAVLVLVGLIISVPIIIWGSKIILFFMTKYPLIIYFGAAILLYTAGKMILHEETIISIIQMSFFPLNFFIPLLIIGSLLLFWVSDKIKGVNWLFFQTSNRKK
ncbi:TerC family protein [Salipaludibacillus daqingensis]|uniref:TerC family protein n=1 Tax=Salipaludibacillus daqingensis TaxID=3041001 RepID=UPI0024768495|nr:TerC family protein [Salipaludibacillus daqingensis]